MHKVHKIAMDIMTCLAIGLGLPEDFYTKVQSLLCSDYDPPSHGGCIISCPIG